MRVCFYEKIKLNRPHVEAQYDIVAKYESQDHLTNPIAFCLLLCFVQLATTLSPRDMYQKVPFG